MTRTAVQTLAFLAAVTAFVVCLAPIGSETTAAENTGVITGTVTSANGPEAGVWVIAETDDLETVFRKIVVTNDDGQYLLPELPIVNFDVWVRGYGLVDSSPVTASPGSELDLAAVRARRLSFTPTFMGSNAYLHETLRLVTAGLVKPVIHRVFPFTQVRDAHRAMLGRENFGKIVLTW